MQEAMTSTHLQIITGGEPIDPAVIAAAGGSVLFCDTVEDWTPPPTMPDIDHGPGVQGLPMAVREALAKAMGKVLETTTGFRVKVYVR